MTLVQVGDWREYAREAIIKWLLSYSLFIILPPFLDIRCIVFFKKSNFFNFDQIYSKKYQHLWYLINTICKYISRWVWWYHFGIIYIDIFIYKSDQSKTNLTFWKKIHLIFRNGGSTIYGKDLQKTRSNKYHNSGF